MQHYLSVLMFDSIQMMSQETHNIILVVHTPGQRKQHNNRIFSDSLAMTELSSKFVKLGFWVNLSQGPVLGQTITTNTQTGTIIIAVLAISTTLGMNHLWHIVTFLWHQARANGCHQNGLIRQQQALFRTLPPPSSAMADFLKLFFAWKKELRITHALRQSLPPTLAALTFTLGSITASIFASFAVVGSNVEVLVSSPLCGLIQSASGYYTGTYPASVALLSDKYARDCYKIGDSTPTGCNIFHRAFVPFTVENASCPFPSERCSSPAVTLDTHLLDLDSHFGMNLPAKDKVRFRVRSTCAVLKLEGLTSVIDAESLPENFMNRPPYPGEQVFTLNFGPPNRRFNATNVTFAMSLYMPGDGGNWGFT